MIRALLGRLRRDDEGSTLPLVIGVGALALILVLVVAAASSLYLERKRLLVLADGAALVGAEAFDLADVQLTTGRPRIQLHPDDVRRDVEAYLAGNPIGEFDALELVQATTVDGVSATVTVAAAWRPPVLTLFVPDGMRVEASATARTVFG